MDFIGGALPNVMFLIGVIAIGIGLGLEFQIIQVKNGLTRGGRIGSTLVGLALVITSIVLYLRPAQTAGTAPAPDVAAAAAAPSAAALPTAANALSAPAEPPTATAAPPTATAEPLVTVPDVRGREPKEAREQLQAAGLRLGEERKSCEELGGSPSEAADLRRGRIACQSAEPGASVPPQTAIDYAVASEKGAGRGD
jgi:hypothetical protein